MNNSQIPYNSQSPVTLDDWLSYIETQHNKTIDLGLTRINTVAKRLGLLDFAGKVLLIGGTNGKGTTAKFLEAYLLSQGYTTALFSSPHLIHYSECLSINGQLLDDHSHIQAFDYIEKKRADIALTPFEYSTLAALKISQDHHPDFVIFEVGMGGRGDATNILNPDVSVITSIALDHQAYLGNDKESIGFEKAGIMRSDKAVIVGELDIPQSVVNYGQQINAKMVCINQHFGYQEHHNHWQWQSDTLQLSPLTLPKIPIQNVATALATLQQLSIEPELSSVNQVLSALQVQGRFERISSAPDIIVDVAHNPHAANYLAEQLAKLKVSQYREIVAVAGMYQDKDISATFACLKDLINRWYLASLPPPRGAQAERLANALENLSTSPYACYHSVEHAMAEAIEAWQPGQLIIVFGSFSTVKEALQGTINE